MKIHSLSCGKGSICRTGRRLAALLITAALLLSGCSGAGNAPGAEPASQEQSRPESENVILLRQKAELLRRELLSSDTLSRLDENPAGRAGNAVFISVCDKSTRASVYSGTGETAPQAWEAALEKTAQALEESGLEPLWVKADIVRSSEPLSVKRLAEDLLDSRSEFYRFGVSFDDDYERAFLEEEMNGCKIYDYDEGGFIERYLNGRLEEKGLPVFEKMPTELRLFRCLGFFCDESSQVYPLRSGRLSAGRRDIEELSPEYIKELIISASDYLLTQLREDGSFVYGIYPRFDNEASGYNILRHAGTTWALICRCRLEPDSETEAAVKKAIDYAATQVIYDDKGAAYLVDAEEDLIKVGAMGIFTLALTEYCSLFGGDEYYGLCTALGRGILSMLDMDTGCYYHVWNTDFSPQEEQRTVYYDGEATFALCRLYGLTGDELWLSAAEAAVDHFIRDDYVRYRDHWLAYSLCEIIRYVPDCQAYYDFALRNAAENLDYIYSRDIANPTALELLMASFGSYCQMLENGYDSDILQLPDFYDTLERRLQRMLSSRFWPEFAMYMENPARILNSFMVREDGFRVRIDDVQHTIGGLYRYLLMYDKLLEYGMEA